MRCFEMKERKKTKETKERKNKLKGLSVQVILQFFRWTYRQTIK
jgi:hypothetical protein